MERVVRKEVIWINFGIALSIRITIIAFRVFFEFIVKRISKSSMYTFTMLASYVFSAHCLPSYRINYMMAPIVLYVDLGVIGIFTLIIVSIKILTRKH